MATAAPAAATASARADDDVEDALLRSWISETIGKEEKYSDLDTSLISLLKDGVDLCELLNSLVPGTVKVINYSSLAFKRLENISNFLDGASEKLSVKRWKLFSSVDLFEERDTKQVFAALRAVKAAVAATTTTPFTPIPAAASATTTPPAVRAASATVSPSLSTPPNNTPSSSTGPTPASKLSSTSRESFSDISAWYPNYGKKVSVATNAASLGVNFDALINPSWMTPPKSRNTMSEPTANSPEVRRKESSSSSPSVIKPASVASLVDKTTDQSSKRIASAAIDIPKRNAQEYSVSSTGRHAPSSLESGSSPSFSASGSAEDFHHISRSAESLPESVGSDNFSTPEERELGSRSLLAGWEARRVGDSVYYYNTKTKLTQLDFPEDYQDKDSEEEIPIPPPDIPPPVEEPPTMRKSKSIDTLSDIQVLQGEDIAVETEKASLSRALLVSKSTSQLRRKPSKQMMVVTKKSLMQMDEPEDETWTVQKGSAEVVSVEKVEESGKHPRRKSNLSGKPDLHIEPHRKDSATRPSRGSIGKASAPPRAKEEKRSAENDKKSLQLENEERKSGGHRRRRSEDSGIVTAREKEEKKSVDHSRYRSEIPKSRAQKPSIIAKPKSMDQLKRQYDRLERDVQTFQAFCTSIAAALRRRIATSKAIVSETARMGDHMTRFGGYISGKKNLSSSEAAIDGALAASGALAHLISDFSEPNLVQNAKMMIEMLEQTVARILDAVEYKTKLAEHIKTAEELEETVHKLSKRAKVNLVQLSEAEKEHAESVQQVSTLFQEAISELSSAKSKAEMCVVRISCAFLNSYDKEFQRGLEICRSNRTNIERWMNFVVQREAVLFGDQDLSSNQGGVETEENEFIRKEGEYFSLLQDIVQAYVAPIMSDGSLFVEITREEVNIIFGNIANILERHLVIQKKIQKGQLSIDDILIHPSTVKNLLQAYAVYLRNYDSALDTLSSVKTKSKTFSNFLKNLETRNKRIPDLTTLLSAPLRQLSVYRKHFENLLTDEQDNQDILHMVEVLRDLDHFEQEQHNRHTTLQVAKLIDELPQDLDLSSMDFVNEWPLEGAGGPIHLFLFSDVLIFAKKASKKAGPYEYQFVRILWAGQISLKVISHKNKSQVELHHPSLKKPMLLTAESTPLRDAVVSEITNAIEKLHGKKVFGVTLPELLNRTDESIEIPSTVKEWITLLQKDHMDLEGIFRISAESLRMEEVRTAIDAGRRVVFTSSSDDGYLISGLLKWFFRSLPEPLLTYDLYNNFLAIADEHKTPRAEVSQKLKSVVEQLPHSNKMLLRSLMEFLNSLSQHSANNLMPASNLAVTFAPHMLCKKEDKVLRIGMLHEALVNGKEGSATSLQLSSGIGALTESSSVLYITERLIKEFPVIFKDIRGSDSSAHAHRAGNLASVLPVGSQYQEITDVNLEKLGVAAAHSTASGGLTISLREIVKQGNLMIKAATRWSTRWFVVKKGFLFYFKKAQDHNPKEVIPLAEGTMTIADFKGGSKGREYGLRITVRGKEYTVACGSEEEIDDWKNAISCCVAPQ